MKTLKEKIDELSPDRQKRIQELVDAYFKEQESAPSLIEALDRLKSEQVIPLMYGWKVTEVVPTSPGGALGLYRTDFSLSGIKSGSAAFVSAWKSSLAIHLIKHYELDNPPITGNIDDWAEERIIAASLLVK